MSNFYLGKQSVRNLEGVHPDLVKVCRRAIEISKLDFGVTEGVRTKELQQQYWQQGVTWTLDSTHLLQHDGYGHAIDVYTRDKKGKISWKHKDFRFVIQAFITAAIEHGVQIEFGGLWRDKQDSPHIQLAQKYYSLESANG